MDRHHSGRMAAGQRQRCAIHQTRFSAAGQKYDPPGLPQLSKASQPASTRQIILYLLPVPFPNRLGGNEASQRPDWAQAVEVDEAIRDKRPPYPLFVHSSRKPLPEAVVIPEDFGAEQLSLFDFIDPDDFVHATRIVTQSSGIDDKDAECDSGYCFL